MVSAGTELVVTSDSTEETDVVTGTDRVAGTSSESAASLDAGSGAGAGAGGVDAASWAGIAATVTPDRGSTRIVAWILVTVWMDSRPAASVAVMSSTV